MMENTTAMPGSSQTTIKRPMPWALLAAAIFLTCFILSLLIPPLQSPDEGAHLERIYLLGKGQLMLETPEGSSSGGMIDSGLRAYLQAYSKFISRPDTKMSQVEIDEANNLRWTGNKEFDAPSGTGYYFPLIYTPQAIGLAAGEALGFTVDTSYRMARFFVLVTTVLVLAWAFLIHRPPIIALALLVLPMSLFQFSTATIDGISTAIFILAISCFTRISIDRQNSKKYLSYTLIACVLIVTSSRAHALPLFALIFASYFYTRDRKVLATSLACLVFVISWLLVSIKLTTNLSFQGAPSAATIAAYYIKDPIALVRVLFHTVMDDTLRTFYLQSFVGILGWLDTKLSLITYEIIYSLIVIIFALSILTAKMKGVGIYRALLITCGIASIGLTFVALLIQWNALQHPATLIQGVQGRYLLIPALLLAYSIGSDQDEKYVVIRYLNAGMLAILFLFSTYVTTSLLISRYFIGVEQQPVAPANVTPSAQLSTADQITLRFDTQHLKNDAALRSVSVLFATHVRKNKGAAKVTLTTKDGKETNLDLDVSSLEDNQYRTFKLDSQPYSSGAIRAESGGGVSVWQTELDSGEIVTCMIYEFSSGAKQYTKGCPRS